MLHFAFPFLLIFVLSLDPHVVNVKQFQHKVIRFYIQSTSTHPHPIPVRG